MDHILFVEDEPVYGATMSRYLGDAGYEVQIAANGEDALTIFLDDEPDVILLDLGLPDIDGMEICRQIRSNSDTPIIILSARDDSVDRVLGLELGADDFVDKRMAPRELLARIRAVTRRSGSRHSGNMSHEVDGYVIDRVARQVRSHGGDIVELTQIEFELLWLFVSHRGEALSREQIFEAVWGSDLVGTSRTIDTHVRTVRKKLDSLRLTTVRSVGYRLEL